jgi:hypothetical protein
MLVYVTAIWYNLWSFGIVYVRLVKFVVLWYVFPVLVRLDQEKSGNPALEPATLNLLKTSSQQMHLDSDKKVVFYLLASSKNWPAEGLLSGTRLPDVYWHNIPKWGKT